MTAALLLALAAPPAFPDPALIDRLSDRRPGVNYREEQVPAYELPDVLGGVDTAADWPARRAELVRSFELHVYGVCPPAPESVQFGRYERIDGLPMVRVTCECPTGRLVFRVTLALPAGASAENPVPLVVLINHREPAAAIGEAGGGTGFWPWRAITDAGFAAAVVQADDLAPDNGGFQGELLAVNGQLQGSARPADGCGALAAWGWGASRVVDYCERTPELDAGRVAVVGHSRGGKAAWWAAARDERFSIAYSNESGCGGAALSRRRFGETVGIITKQFPHWFAPNFAAFAEREDELPVDQHQLAAAIAPRAVYAASAADDLWADPRGEFLSLVGANPAFALFGDAPLDADEFPAVGEQVVRGRRGYHLRPGSHDLTREDWDRFLAFAAGVWETEPGGASPPAR